MPINQKNLDTKLAALRGKDLDAIVAAQVYIPFLSRPYTKTRLQNWLNKRIDQLERVRDATDEQIATDGYITRESTDEETAVIATQGYLWFGD